MTKATDSNNAHSLPSSGPVLDQWRVHSDTGAHHGGSLDRGDSFRNLNHEMRRDPRVLGIATRGFGTVGVARVKRVTIARVFAMVLEPIRALLTVWPQARGRLGANTDAVTDLDPPFGFLTHAYSPADDLVADLEDWSIRCVD